MVLIAVIVVVAVVVVVLAVALWAAFNGLIKKRNRTQEAWSEIDVELKRRHDLIPNLVSTVQGYASHEQGTFEAVTQARANAVTAGSSGDPARSVPQRTCSPAHFVRCSRSPRTTRNCVQSRASYSSRRL